ncbi:MAG: DUF4124 domain-containing protein [Pseudomonadota bacterium]
MMKYRYLFVLVCCAPLVAQAEIYKAVDADGHVTYSSSPIKGGKKLQLEPLPTMVPQARTRQNSPEDFPKVDESTQRSRDDTRRTILEDELEAETKLLEQAKQNLQEGEAKPEVFHSNGKTFRNVAKYDEKIKTLTEQVELHRKNVDALKTELSKLK